MLTMTLLLLAAAQLQKTLSPEAAAPSADSHATSDVLSRAKDYAKGRADMTGIADDIDALTSKGCSVRYGCQNPYTR